MTEKKPLPKHRSQAANRRISMLYKKFGSATHQRIVRHIRDPQEAWDLTQDIFQSLLGVAESLEDSERTYHYLFRTTTHAIYHYFRQASRRHKVMFEVQQRRLVLQELNGSVSPSILKIYLEQLQMHMAPEDWELLYYKFVEEMTTGELSLLLQISDRAVRKRLQRLQERLPSILNKMDAEKGSPGG